MKAGMDDVFKDIKDKDGFENYINFRNIFFSGLFKFSYSYSQKYHIKSMEIVDDLEDEIGY